MASLSRLFTLFSFVVISNFLLLPNAVLCDVKDVEILRSLNKHRQSKNLSELTHNKNAACLATKLVYRLRDQSCATPQEFISKVSSETDLADFNNLLSKCRISYNSSVDGISLPTCVPTLDPDSVVSTFNHSFYVEYLNYPNYTGAGVATADNWVAIVLSTNTSTGNFMTSGTSSVIARGGCIGAVVAFVGLFVSLFM